MKLDTALETPDHSGTYVIDIPHRPTKSPYAKKSWLRRVFCRHTMVYLYRDDIMFFQERVGYALHYACNQCGDVRVTETD